MPRSNSLENWRDRASRLANKGVASFCGAPAVIFSTGGYFRSWKNYFFRTVRPDIIRATADRLLPHRGSYHCLKGRPRRWFLGDWHKIGIELTAVLKDGRGCPKDFQGGIVTYQQLPNFVSTVEQWAKTGVRLFVVFDEIHHTTENVWGAAAERLARCAGMAGGKMLAMTGTPFRGDGRRISFVNYDDNDVAISDARYTYRQAVADTVCRPVQFITDDGIAEFIRGQEERDVHLSDAKTEEDLYDATKTIFAATRNG